MAAMRRLLCALLLGPIATATAALREGPVFVNEPLDLIEFSNTTGARIACQVRGSPKPQVSWRLADDSPITAVAGLRQLLPNGTLLFPPFKAEDYRQDVHAVVYRCSASNPIGTIVSRDVKVKAVIDQPFDVHVYDVYVIKGNTAVMKCHIPTMLSDYVTVTSWIRDGAFTIPAAKLEDESKYVILPSGELLIRNAQAEDGITSFRCEASHKLASLTKMSINAGKLFVTEPENNIPPRVVESRANVEGVQGSDVALPCVTQGRPVPRITWMYQIGSQLISIPKDDRFVEAKEALVIRNLRASDAGTYMCVATNEVGTEKVQTRLNVKEMLTVVTEPKMLVVDVGKKAQINCEVSGSPVTSVIWLKDSKQVKIEPISIGLKRFVYEFNPVKTSSKGMYQCVAKNNYLTVHATTEIHLGDMPPSIDTTFKEDILHPRASLSLQCTASGRPTPRLAWTLDGTTVKNAISRVLSDDSVIGWVNITNVRNEDGGVYTCKAVNVKGTAEYSARIHVYGPLTAREKVKISAVAGESLWINCPVFGYPVDNIAWEKGGRLLPANFRQVINENGTLLINGIRRGNDGGKYSCVATNRDGQNVKADVDVTVLIAPKITPFSFQDDLVREGSRARLQCVVSEGDLPITLKWLKDGNIIPSNVGINIRDLDDFSSILTIPSINPRHNGNYTCIASNSAAQTSHSALLAVNVSPKIIPFAFQDDHVFEGVLARISCVVYQGDLPINIEWIKDGKPVESVEGIVVRVIDEYSSILTIENVQMKHAGNYTCVASNAAAIVNHSAQLVVNVPPKIVPFSFQDEQLLVGMLVRVSCVVSRGDLPLIITWQKDRRDIPAQFSITVRDFDEYSSVLSIDPVTVQHNGNYTCTAKNDAGADSFTANLVVKVPPRWTVKPDGVVNGKKTTVKGEDVILDCQADGFPKPTIQWMTAKSSGPSVVRVPAVSKNNIEILRNSSLWIRGVMEYNEGYYFCIASNGVGDDLSEAIYVNVHAPVRFDVTHRNETVRKGEEAILACEATGDLPINFTWSVNGKTIKGANSGRYKVNYRGNITKNSALSELVIANIGSKDSNALICTAKNAYGIANSTIQLIVQEPPKAPVIEKTEFVGEHSVRVYWKVPSTGNSPITKILLQYTDVKGGISKNLTLIKWDSQTVISDLQPATTYQTRVKIMNEIGSSGFSEPVTFTTQEEAPSGAPQKIEIESTDKQSLRITWQPPDTNTQNGIIRGYYIGYKIHQTPDSYTFVSFDIPEDYTDDLIYQLSDLKMYTQYAIVVQAYNSKGRGPPSEEVVVMTSEDVPNQSPQNVRCSSLSTQNIYVIWDAPPPETVNGILRGYKVFFKPVDEWYDASTHWKNAQTPKLTLQGLEVNTNYSIQVLAFTKMGDGAKSNAIYCKTHEDVPSAPGDIKALPTSADSMLISWKPPSRPNGAVTKYNVYARSIDDDEEVGPETRYSKDANPRTSSTSDASIHSSQDDLIYEINGLNKNHRYEFWVTAVSGIGEGPRSRIVSQMTSGPTLSAKSASFDEIKRTPWKRDLSMPCRAVGTPPPEKIWLLGGKPLPKNERMEIAADGTLVIKNIESEDAGNYTCSIKNIHGTDEVNYAVFVLVPPSPPKLGVYSKTMSSLHLKWHPGFSGGDPIRGYILHYKRDAGQWEKKQLAADQQSFILDNLACGITYQIYMESFNNIGIGAPCEVIAISTEGSAVEPPAKDQLIREGPTFLSLHLDTWPTSGCPIQYFVAEYRKNDEPTWTVVNNQVKPSQKRLVIPGLVPGNWYHVRVTAHTTGGVSPVEYLTATLTRTGATIAPGHIPDQVDEKIILFHLDPWILITASVILVGLLAVLIIICVCIKRRNNVANRKVQARKRPSMESFVHVHGSEPIVAKFYATLNRPTIRSEDEPSPYATSTLPGCLVDEMRTLGRRHHSIPTPSFQGSHEGTGRPPPDTPAPFSPAAQSWSSFTNSSASNRPMLPPNGPPEVKEGKTSSIPPTPRRSSDTNLSKSGTSHETTFVFPAVMDAGIPISSKNNAK